MNNKTLNPKTPSNSITRVWESFTAPHPSIRDLSERRRARLLATVSLILTASFTWAMLSSPTSYGTFIALFSITLISYALSRTRQYVAGSYFFTFAFTAMAFISLYLGTASSFGSSLTSIGHVSLIVASILLPVPGLIVLVVLATAAAFAAPFYAQTPVVADASFFRDSGVFMSLGVILIGANIFRAWLERDRLREVQNMNRELQDLTANLEQRVNERTLAVEAVSQQNTRRVAQLQAITELSEAIAQVKDLGSLFQTTTELISERFGFYHVGMFLLDNEREYAVLQAANSEGGKKMLARAHRLKLGTGVVGYVARLGRPRIALDVGSDAVYFDNPDLPETRSEAALPLKARDETIGVLDVQSTVAGAFSHEDLQVLTALANQVAIAFENTRLLTETRAALRQVEEVYDEFTRAEWSRAAAKAEQPGFRYQAGRIEMIEKSLNTPEAISAVNSGAVVTNRTNGSTEKRHTVAIPVRLRGEVIGVLQIESNDPSRTWQEDEIGLVEAVAERAAYALENARLFQDARRRAAKERLISEATSKISGALNLENILQTTAQELERVLGGSEVLIRFQTKEPK
jgi:GAF domain-containing protein